MSADDESDLTVEECRCEAGLLVVSCSGRWGIGSKGAPSSERVRRAVGEWRTAHPDEPVTEVTLDLTRVAYEWGDGPSGCLLHSIVRLHAPRGVILASKRNHVALEGLVRSCGTPSISVEVREDSR